MTKSMDLPRWSLEDRCLQPGSVLYSLGWKNTSIVQVVPTDFLSKMGIFGDTSFSWKTYHWSIEIYIYKWVSTKDADISPPYSSGFPICSSMTGATLGEPSLRRYLLLDRWEQWTCPLLLAAEFIRQQIQPHSQLGGISQEETDLWEWHAIEKKPKKL